MSYLYGHTPFCIKNTENGAFVGIKNRTMGIKLGMQAQLDSTNNMGWVPYDHTSFFLCVWTKMVILIYTLT